MEVIKKGRGFILEVTCEHCQAILGVNRSDMAYFEETTYSPPSDVSVMCPECRNEVSIPRTDWPANYTSLPRWSNAWRDSGGIHPDNGPK